jgi:glycine cleavage system transcriptional repressor
VQTVTKLLLARGANVETSRMARLGGEFAMLMLVTVPSEQLTSIDEDLLGLVAQGYKITTTRAERSYAEKYLGWVPYRIEAHGADHEGLIHELALYLSERGINIESMESETFPAPLSGAPLITMTAEVIIPPSVVAQDWEHGLHKLGHHLNLEIKTLAMNAS